MNQGGSVLQRWKDETMRWETARECQRDGGLEPGRRMKCKESEDEMVWRERSARNREWKEEWKENALREEEEERDVNKVNRRRLRDKSDTNGRQRKRSGIKGRCKGATVCGEGRRRGRSEEAGEAPCLTLWKNIKGAHETKQKCIESKWVRRMKASWRGSSFSLLKQLKQTCAYQSASLDSASWLSGSSSAGIHVLFLIPSIFGRGTRKLRTSSKQPSEFNDCISSSVGAGGDRSAICMLLSSASYQPVENARRRKTKKSKTKNACFPLASLVHNYLSKHAELWLFFQVQVFPFLLFSCLCFCAPEE